MRPPTFSLIADDAGASTLEIAILLGFFAAVIVGAIRVGGLEQHAAAVWSSVWSGLLSLWAGGR